jgi:hypothetical protein
MLMLTVVSPEPLTVCVDDLLPYDPLTRPYSNHAVVDNPFAFTISLNVAEFDVRFVADPIDTEGAAP